ncbi:MAG: aminopeptidase PepB [Candidatus Arsenophonus melophagi]|nr:aminopeptidase PepB [Candidatus Arsenophonus melophagi]
MNKQIMQVSLSYQSASPCWGKDALISMSEQGTIIHLKSQATLCTIQRAGRRLDSQGMHHVMLVGDNWDLEKSWAFWQGFRVPKLTHSIEWPTLSELEKEELQYRIHIIDWVRDIINIPAEELAPEQLAQRSADLLCKIIKDKINYRIIHGEELKKQKYNGIYTVGRGSSRPPALLALDYNPNDNLQAPVFACLVGKGITFDSGGYSIKPSASMNSMKADMSGAAMLTGALALAICRGLKKRIKLFLCIADNMISGNALKLGDIIRFCNGKSVEIMNSDAEGRLVLADGLIEADKNKPVLIIDAGTLTGAAKIAVDNDYQSVLSFDDALVSELMSCAEIEHELFWRLPLAEFHRRRLPSSFADLNNIALPSYNAEASIAAAFLSHFVENYRKGWLHIDCSANYCKSAMDLWSAGATGIGVRTIASLLLKKAKQTCFV